MSINERNSVWQKTKTQHLIRYLPKGTFYAYFKVGGKPFRKSLRTHVYSVAKLRLGDEIAEQRELAEASTNQSAGKLTFADVVELYRARIGSEPRLKPASRRYRLTSGHGTASGHGIDRSEVRRNLGRQCRADQKRCAPHRAFSSRWASTRRRRIGDGRRNEPADISRARALVLSQSARARRRRGNR